MRLKFLSISRLHLPIIVLLCSVSSAACQATQYYSATIGETGSLRSDDIRIRENDLVVLLDQKGRKSRLIRAGSLLPVGEWLCELRAKPYSDMVRSLRITGLERESLGGVLKGLPVPTQLIRNGSDQVLVKTEGLDLKNWLMSPDHVEPNLRKRWYQVEFVGGALSPKMNWSETKKLLTKVPNRFGWSREQVANVYVRRVESNPGPIVAALLIGGLAAAGNVGSGASSSSSASASSADNDSSFTGFDGSGVRNDPEHWPQLPCPAENATPL